MKKYIYIIGIATLSFLASCGSDDDLQPVQESTINITSAQTSLGPNVSEGTVTVDCQPTEAYTNAPSWLTTTVEGNTVKFVSTANATRESRNAKLVIKKTDKDSVIVNISQYGLVLTMDKESIIINDDKAGTFTKTCHSNTDIKLLETPSWIKTSLNENGTQLTVDVEPNTTGHLRACYVKYQAAAVVDSFLVKQFDFDTDIAGKYAFGYYDFDENEKLQLQVVECTIDREYLSVPEWGFQFPISVNDSIGAITMKSNQYLGRYGKYYAYSLFVDRQGAAYYNNGTGLATCSFIYDEEEGLGTSGFFQGYAFKFNGTEADGFLGMMIKIFKAKAPSPSNDIGNWGWVLAPYVWKVTKETPGTEKQARKLAAKQQFSVIQPTTAFHFQ